MLSGDVPAARKVIGALLPARRYRGVSSIWRECIPHRTPHGAAHRDRTSTYRRSSFGHVPGEAGVANGGLHIRTADVEGLSE